MDGEAIRDRSAGALDALVEQLKTDRAVLAAMLCGSLSHDVVWEKPDIDLMLVTVDDRHAKTSDLPILADGINVHAVLVPRAEFRTMVEGTLQHSFLHSFLSKGRLLYTHDETIAGLCQRLTDVGRRDTERQLFRAASHALAPIDKARKAVGRALDCIDAYLAARAPAVFRPVLDHLREVGEARSARDLEDHFTRHLNLSGVTSVCEYLVDQQMLGQASAPVRLTRTSTVEVQELAFFYVGDVPSKG